MTTIAPILGCNPEQFQKEFQDLARHWREERGPTSSTTDMAMCPSYQRIIGLGPAVITLILRELERDPDHWFWALKAITGVDPVAPERRGRLRDMAQDWITWGRQQGYQW
jgi:hypothetical protein